MAEHNISTAGKVAIALAIFAGLLSVSNAIYNYVEHRELNIIKIAAGIGVPFLFYAIVKTSSRAK